MRRRRDHWAAPPRGGKPPTEPVTHIDLYPNPLPPPSPPLTREENLTRVQSGFATLDETELRVALLWLTGEMLEDICEYLNKDEDVVRKVWQKMRRKLRDGVQGNA